MARQTISAQSPNAKVGDDVETCSISSFGSHRHSITEAVDVPTTVSYGSSKYTSPSGCPSVCSSSVSSAVSSKCGRKKKPSYRTLDKEIIAHLRAELEQTKSELESNRTLAQKLLEENQTLRTEANNANARADHLEDEVKRLSSPLPETPARKLRGNFGTLQSLQFELDNVEPVARAKASGKGNSTGKAAPKEMKEEMIDVDLVDKHESSDAISRRLKSRLDKTKKRKDKFVRPAASSTAYGRNTTRMTVEVPIEEEDDSSLASGLRGMFRRATSASVRSGRSRGNKFVLPEELLWENDNLSLASERCVGTRDSWSSQNSVWSVGPRIMSSHQA